MHKIRSLARYNALLVMPTGITVVLNDDKRTEHHFQSFVHREEAFELLNYLWKHVPIYVDVPELAAHAHPERSTSADSSASSSTSLARHSRLTTSAPQQSTVATSSATGSARHQEQQQQQLQHVQVDTQRTKRILRTLDETEKVGAATAVQLAEQGEQLRSADAGLDRIEADLRHGDHILKGMSLGGALRNQFAIAPRAAARAAPAVAGLDSSALNSDLNAFDVEVLLKKPDDSLVPAVMRFDENSFSFYSTKNRTERLKGTGYARQEWHYRDVDMCVVRARHLHMDVLLKNNVNTKSTEKRAKNATARRDGADDDDDDGFHMLLPADKAARRVRLLSAYLQVICNELHFRTGQHQNGKACPVKFAAKVRRFAYGSLVISNGAGSWRLVMRGADLGVLSAKTSGLSFNRTSAAARAAATAPRFSTVDDATNKAVLQQEEDLYEIGDQLDLLKAMGRNMGTEIGNQTDLLDSMNAKTDRVTAHMKRTTKKINEKL
eukprot:TRINITY_DN2658_c0_g3_i1.p1 TRINITY_DN2658_c0_g3~~TRINITY_DN2658_c0_g3_i1.p1  ORF type:complete len:494 (-),score=139.58 TRINITY_DN2658_c0_g3_i1:17-1498(-)